MNENELKDEEIELDPNAIKNDSYGTFGDQYKGYNFFSEEAFENDSISESLRESEVFYMQNTILSVKEDTDTTEYINEDVFFSSSLNTTLKNSQVTNYKVSYTSYFFIGIISIVLIVMLIKKNHKRRTEFNHKVDIMEKREEV